MSNEQIILDRLDCIEKLLRELNLIKKEVLTIIEAAEYLEISQSHLYKLTSTGSIPCYKPNGKKVYFNRAELDKWLLTNRQASKADIEQKADEFLLKRGRIVL